MKYKIKLLLFTCISSRKFNVITLFDWKLVSIHISADIDIAWFGVLTVILCTDDANVEPVTKLADIKRRAFQLRPIGSAKELRNYVWLFQIKMAAPSSNVNHVLNVDVSNVFLEMTHEERYLFLYSEKESKVDSSRALTIHTTQNVRQ
ncbi:hypothetical protein CHS0354_028581 [Potamilus streckersoni]|uniref:Uncharacterized protein n=1 Tax=Potamilus streckersoni TaxID=2493646 RepID=A0AAE0SPB1_9BIVA|nr:hypothetical protein CHS0354_028581 [Potamilus streckersoni]